MSCAPRKESENTCCLIPARFIGRRCQIWGKLREVCSSLRFTKQYLASVADALGGNSDPLSCPHEDVRCQRPETLFWALIDMSYSFFQREGPVFLAGNDPDPADVCPTGRGRGHPRSTLSSHFCCEIHYVHTPRHSFLVHFFFLGFSVRGFQELPFIQVYFEKHLMMYELSLSLSAPLIQKCTTMCINYPFSGFPSWIVAPPPHHPPSRSAAEFRLPV